MILNAANSSNPADDDDPWTSTPKPYFPHFLPRNSAQDTQLFCQEESITPEGAQLQYWRSPVVQKEDHMGTGFGIKISKGTCPGLSEPVWNLYLDCGCNSDLIQNIFWHPIPPQCHPTIHLFLAREFPSNTAIRSHLSPLLLSSALFSLLHPTPSRRQFGPQG